MLRAFVFLNLILCSFVLTKRRHKEISDKSESDDAGTFLVASLRNDKNLDLSMDEEYEDLRAELLAYHTALSSLTGPQADEAAGTADAGAGALADIPNTRRSMKTTPCWKLGGICVKQNLCKDTRFLTEVPGCKSNLEVCCFTWNTFQTTDLRDKGIGNSAFPWSRAEPIGSGRGLIGLHDSVDTKSSLDNELSVYNFPIQFSHGKEEKKKRKQKKKKHTKRNKAPVVVIVKPNDK